MDELISGQNPNLSDNTPNITNTTGETIQQDEIVDTFFDENELKELWAANKLTEKSLTKQCGKCGVEKDFSDFRKSKTGKYGRHGYCKKCHSGVSKEKYSENKQERIVQVKRWNSKNHHKTRQYQNRWRLKTGRGNV